VIPGAQQPYGIQRKAVRIEMCESSENLENLQNISTSEGEVEGIMLSDLIGIAGADDTLITHLEDEHQTY
jgi:hypothetical protein